MPAATSVMSRATTHSTWRDLHPERAPGPRNNRAVTLRWSRYSSTPGIPIQAGCCFIPLAPKAAEMCFTLADGSSPRSAIQPGACSPRGLMERRSLLRRNSGGAWMVRDNKRVDALGHLADRDHGNQLHGCGIDRRDRAQSRVGNVDGLAVG